MKPIVQDRRQFLAATSAAMAALVASGCTAREVAMPVSASGAGYGPLKPDPAGFIDLPEGFSYRVISRLGDAMNDGATVPDRADGMGCFDLGNGKIALIRNHELRPEHAPEVEVARGFRRGPGGNFLPGGTTTLVLDAESLAIERQFRSLAGTYNNCAGGITPWGSWLSCEEAGTSRTPTTEGHGWVFEVPVTATGPVAAEPLTAMGRFRHEAACVDPATGIVYLTEDRDDGLLYRFLPKVPGRLGEGGRLQALAIGGAAADTRNWSASTLAVGEAHTVRWIDLDNVEAPDDDLRARGAAAGAAVFARGEGIHMGEGELYFCCTSGGSAGLGQVFRLRLAPATRGGTLDLYYESTDPDQFNYGDNLTVAPDGQLVVCEDQYTSVVTNHLRGISRTGQAYPIALLRAQTEWAGACFSPDGRVLFVNAYSPTATLAITGPWQHLG